MSKSLSHQSLIPAIMGKTATYMRAKYRRIPEAIHVHDLTRCSHKRVMEERYPELAEKTLFVPAVQIGEALHTFVESLPTIDRAQQIVERRVNRHLVVGRPDITTEDAVYDLKFRRRLYRRALDHDVLTAGIYAWLTRKPHGHIIYLNPSEFREWVVDPVTTEDVLYLVEHPKSPRWDWECRLCPFKRVCTVRVRGSHSPPNHPSPSSSPQFMPMRTEILDKALELFFEENPEAPIPEEHELKEGNYWIRARDTLLRTRAIPLSEWERYRADVRSLAEELNILEEAAEERVARERERWLAEIERVRIPPPPKVPVPVKPLDALIREFLEGRITYEEYERGARGL